MTCPASVFDKLSAHGASWRFSKVTAMTETTPITQLLRQLAAGDVSANEQLLPLVYAELRALAAQRLRSERAGYTLSPTALVHEVYLRFADDESFAPADRRQFYAVAARRMRQILVDHARHRDAERRGGDLQRVTWSALDELGSSAGIDSLALDQALTQLEAMDARKAHVVELRYFAGLEMDEIAAQLQISRATAQRDWEVARSFLYRALT
ncbi:ECF-type sigma factor [Dokdonella soli]